MIKKIKAYVKLQVAAGMANPSPPVGPALGQQGLNIMEFCKLFNERTIHLEKGLPIPVIITVYSDRSFTFLTKSPPVSVLLKKASGVQHGSKEPKKIEVGKVTVKQVYEIAKIKSSDMTGADFNAIVRSVLGTASSMGLIVDKDLKDEIK